MTEQIRITIGTPHMRDFTPEYVVSLTNTLLDGRYRYSCNFRQGSVIHLNRNGIARQCETDYLLFIDSDMSWLPDNVQALVEADKDIATALCFNRTYPWNPPFIPKSQETNYHEIISRREPCKLFSSGCGFMLIKKKVLEAFFSQGIWPFDPIPLSAITDEVMCSCSDGEGNEGFDSSLYWEDHSFCCMARKLGFEVWLIPTASVGHVGESLVMEKPPWESWLTATSKIRGCRNTEQFSAV